jgi:hypothetical protein
MRKNRSNNGFIGVNGAATDSFSGTLSASVLANKKGLKQVRNSSEYIRPTNGNGKDGTATVTLTNGTLASVVVTAVGSGYTSDPTVVFTGGGGTGAAADTAFRAAINQGFELLARTDADALVDMVWTKSIREHFLEHPAGLASGITGPIVGELNLSQYSIFRGASALAATFGLFRPSNYGNGRRGRYVMTNGNNLAIDSKTYLVVGGFRRSKIEELHEDRALVNDVRAAGGKVYRVRAMKVQVSARRIQAWGLFNSLKWYANHSFEGNQIDIR